MLMIKIIGFIAVFIGISAINLSISFWVAYEPSLYGHKLYNFIFIIPYLYVISVALAFIVQNNTTAYLPYGIASLTIILLIGFIIPKMHKVSSLRKVAYDQEFMERYIIAKSNKEFICSPNSFITHSTETGNMTKYSDEQADEREIIIASVNDIDKTITPVNRLRDLKPQEFIKKYSCKNTKNKTMFDYYTFEPEGSYINAFLGTTILQRGTAINKPDGVIIETGTSTTIYIDTLKAWPTNILGKEVVIKGLITKDKTIYDDRYIKGQLNVFMFKDSIWKSAI